MQTASSHIPPTTHTFHSRHSSPPHTPSAVNLSPPIDQSTSPLHQPPPTGLPRSSSNVPHTPPFPLPKPLHPLPPPHPSNPTPAQSARSRRRHPVLRPQQVPHRQRTTDAADSGSRERGETTTKSFERSGGCAVCCSNEEEGASGEVFGVEEGGEKCKEDDKGA